MVDAILYISKIGCQLSMLPKDFAPWQSVYYYYRKWKFNGLLEEIHDYLVAKLRLNKVMRYYPR
ncbi:transposase [Olleya sp. AH-315-K02]|nr:transposase [Olleya sp. AH-315-K02]